MQPLMNTYATPAVTFVGGSGTELFDDKGKRYLDFLCGIAVTSLGHAHPRVASAIAEQAGRLLHVSNLFGNEVGPRVAGALDLLVGDGQPAGGKVFFCNSGAEANECALKLVRRARPGRYGVVSALGSFHGRTLATLAATGQPGKKEAFEPMPAGFTQVPFGDIEALRDVTVAPEVGAVILESIQGESGVIPSPPGYLEAARALCEERDILLLLDEVQTGLGRTGRWFGFQHTGIAPDIVTMAKALGNGMPIGACWASAEVAAAFKPGDHGSTFGGQPLAAAAALATLQVMHEIDAPSLAQSAGATLSAALRQLPGVADVRGSGLLLGVVLEPGLDAKSVVKAALDSGLVLNSPVEGVMRVTPPLTVSETEIAEAVSILRGVLAVSGVTR
jgi:predicted acetylornithine/succinylornithine family transaminase